MIRVEETVVLRCPCGTRYGASARQARRVRSGEALARCPGCRTLEIRKPFHELKTPQLLKNRAPITDRDRLWWLERMTLAELIEICEAIYGEPPSPIARARWERLIVAPLAQPDLQAVGI